MMKHTLKIGFDTRKLGMCDNVKALSLIKYAFDKGVRLFDVSPHFMKGASEKIFLESVKAIASDIDISYRFGRIPQESDSRESFIARFDASLARFGAESFEVYTVYEINSLETWHEYRDLGEVYKTAAEMKVLVKIKHLAVSSCLDADELSVVLEACPEIDTVFMPISPFDVKRHEKTVAMCKNMGKTVYAQTPLLGDVVRKYPEITSPIHTEGLDNEQASLKYVSQLCENILIPFESEEMADRMMYALSDEAADVEISGEFGAYETFCTGCGLCMMCMIKSNVTDLMSAYNEYIVSGEPQDMVEAVKRTFGEDDYMYQSRKCIGCRMCERICPQGIKISERIEKLRDEVYRT